MFISKESDSDLTKIFLATKKLELKIILEVRKISLIYKLRAKKSSNKNGDSILERSQKMANKEFGEGVEIYLLPSIIFYFHNNYLKYLYHICCFHKNIICFFL